MTRLRTALMTAVISGLLLGVLPASAASEFQKASDLYSKGQFQAAADAYIDAICAHPDSYAAHYALANTYMKLGKMDQAQTEYEMARDLYPDKTTKANISRALAYLNGTSISTIVGARHDDRLDAMLANEGQRRAEKAQAAVEAQKAQLERNAQRAAERYKENAKAQVEAMKENSTWWCIDRNQGTMIPVIPPGVEENVLETAQKQAEHAVNSAKAKGEALKPALGTTDVTDGLRSQINGSGVSGVRLSPVGTNIYVRNYESTQVAGKSGGVK